MIVHVLQHSDRVPPDGIATWAAARGVELAVSRVDRYELPSIEDVDRLVVLGGEMNTDEVRAHPWIAQERGWLGDVLERGRARVLGICLGSQLLAEVLGGSVGRMPGGAEIGWHPVELTEAGRQHPSLAGLPARFDSFEWHGDAWELPPGAELVITGAGCATQAFTHGTRVTAAQFHPEFTQSTVRERAQTTDDDLTAGGLVQRPEQFVNETERFAALAQVRDALLDAALNVTPR